MTRQSPRCISTANEGGQSGPGFASVTVFLCADCARPAQLPGSAGRSRPVVPDFAWPWPVRQILLPCTGRLQPEHVLRAFESGADLVCVVGCQQDNCHYVEGSKRCARRVDYLRSIFHEVGLGGERLLFLSLPGTAAEDMALATGRPARVCEDVDAQLAAVRDRVMQVLDGLPPNPLHGGQTDKGVLCSCLEDDNAED